jgi:hypothetical protein
MAQSLPIKFQELLTLNNIGVEAASIGFNSCVSTHHQHHCLSLFCSFDNDN